MCYQMRCDSTVASALPPPYHRLLVPPRLDVCRRLTVSLSSSLRSSQAISVTVSASTCIMSLACFSSRPPSTRVPALRYRGPPIVRKRPVDHGEDRLPAGLLLPGFGPSMRHSRTTAPDPCPREAVATIAWRKCPGREERGAPERSTTATRSCDPGGSLGGCREHARALHHGSVTGLVAPRIGYGNALRYNRS